MYIMKRKAYSYIRYSSPKQRWGDSKRRQYDLTQEYCDKNNLDLVEKYEDLGISGYKSKTGNKHTDQEALQKLIEDIDEGRIPEGSVLIVENLDRLSREHITDALSQFMALLKKIDIYTSSDGKLYESSRDPSALAMDLIISITVMTRAHEESAIKSSRLKASWDNKRANITNKKLSPNGPHWLKLNEDGTDFLLLPERVATIQKIYQLTKEGYGATRLVKYLNDNLDKHPSPGRRHRNSNNELEPTNHWASTTVKRILQDKSVMGEYQPHKGNNSNRKAIGEPIPDYYPQIISPDDFYSVQGVKAQRKVGKGRTSTSFSNLFRGFLYCGECHKPMEYTNKGKPPKGGQYLVCSSAKRGAGCTNTKHYRYKPLELMLLHALPLNEVIPPVKKVNHEELLKVEGLLLDAEKTLENFLSSDPDLSINVVYVHFQKLQGKVSVLKESQAKLQIEANKTTPIFTYEGLLADMVNEPEVSTRFDNRKTLNAFLQSVIDKADIYIEGDSIYVRLSLLNHQPLIDFSEVSEESMSDYPTVKVTIPEHLLADLEEDFIDEETAIILETDLKYKSFTISTVDTTVYEHNASNPLS